MLQPGIKRGKVKVFNLTPNIFVKLIDISLLKTCLHTCAVFEEILVVQFLNESGPIA